MDVGEIGVAPPVATIRRTYRGEDGCAFLEEKLKLTVFSAVFRQRQG
jgi:hypothetical protein